MSGWQAGDLALCVAHIPEKPRVANGRGLGWRPSVGSIHVVTGVYTSADFETWPEGVVGLVLEPDPWAGFNQDFFRKVTPPAADEFDRETIELMASAPELQPA